MDIAWEKIFPHQIINKEQYPDYIKHFYKSKAKDKQSN